ncbi:hypothetical protein MPSEU_000345700 [Mayamaea pseudoterrestris]|nr:hypothetical protein MPSEU_000345700 [Mayamaea pseudoterrestris]
MTDPNAHDTRLRRFEEACEEAEDEIVWNAGNYYNDETEYALFDDAHNLDLMLLACDDWMRNGGSAAQLVELYNHIRSEMPGMGDDFVTAVNEMLDTTEPELYRRIVCEGSQGSHWYLLPIMADNDISREYTWDGDEGRLLKYDMEWIR